MAFNENQLLSDLEHLFYGKTSYFQALGILLRMTLIDPFKLSTNKPKTISGFVLGLLLSALYIFLLLPHKAILLYVIFGSVGSLIVSVLLSALLGQGGFLSFLFYAGAIFLVVSSTPFIALICCLPGGQYFRLKEDAHGYRKIRIPRKRFTRK